MKKKTKLFEGLNLKQLDLNVAKFKEEICDRFIDSYLNSNNPQYVIVVEYWDESKLT